MWLCWPLLQLIPQLRCWQLLPLVLRWLPLLLLLLPLLYLPADTRSTMAGSCTSLCWGV
jgi:hypothetical protein